jgi:hypothetical protein
MIDRPRRELTGSLLRSLAWAARLWMTASRPCTKHAGYTGSDEVDCLPALRNPISGHSDTPRLIPVSHRVAHSPEPSAFIVPYAGPQVEIVLPQPHPDEQPNSLFSNSSFVGTCRFSMIDVITLRSKLKVSRMSSAPKLGCPCAAEERLS